MDYIGTVTGIIGAITAIIAIAISIRSARKVDTMKSLDLRLELRRNVVDAHLLLDNLVMKIEEARTSKKQNFAASGLLNSGYAEQYLSQCSSDLHSLGVIKVGLPDIDDQYPGKSPADLEHKLISIHETLTNLKDLDAKYSESLADDKRAGEKRAEEAQQRIADQNRQARDEWGQ